MKIKGKQNENIGFNTMYDAASFLGRSIAQVLYILELVFDSDEIVVSMKGSGSAKIAAIIHRKNIVSFNFGLDEVLDFLKGCSRHCQRSYAMYDKISTETNTAKFSINEMILHIVVPKNHIPVTSHTTEFGIHNVILNKSIKDRLHKNVFVTVLIVPLLFR